MIDEVVICQSQNCLHCHLGITMQRLISLILIRKHSRRSEIYISLREKGSAHLERCVGKVFLT